MGEIVKVAMPCFLEQLMGVLAGVISTIIVGRLGANEMTATAMSNTLINWLQCAYVGLSAGATVVVGRLYGMKEHESIKKATLQTIKVALLLSFVISGVIMLFQEQIVNLFYGSAEAKVIENVHIYLFWALLGMPAIAGMNALGSCLRGTGDNKTSLYTSTMVNIANLILSFAMIYGFEPFGIRPMGILGAGIAVTAARYLGLVFLYVFVLIRRRDILPKKYSFGFNVEILRKVLKVGVPSALEQFIFNGGFVILQSILVSFGTIFQAGYQIGTNISNMLQTVSIALNVAAVALISQCIGAKKFDVAEEYVKAIRFIIYTVVTTIAVLMFILSPWMASMFSTEPEVIEEGIFFSRVFSVMILPIAHMQAMSGILKGAGDTRYVAITSTVAMWIFRIFGIWAFSQLFGNAHIAFILGLAGDFVLRAVMYDVRVRNGKWMHIKI